MECGRVYVFFFFQAEDGIRDVAVTGVQTCALPISFCRSAIPAARSRRFAPRRCVRCRCSTACTASCPRSSGCRGGRSPRCPCTTGAAASGGRRDRKSTRLNSSHGYISYAVFCLKKKKNKQQIHPHQQHTQKNRDAT